MSAHRFRPDDSGADEPPLSGIPVRSSRALTRLLAAAAAAARPEELAGEEAAVAAFRAAARPHPRGRSLVARLLTVKVAAVAASVVVAGVAVASVTGHLPSRPGGTSIDPATNRVTSPTIVTSHTDGGTGTGTRHGTGAVPTVSLPGLCHAYLAGATDHGAAANPAFTALFAAAGGRSNAATYCDHLPGAATTPPAGPKPTPSKDNPAHRTGEPSTHPTGPPTTHPHPTH
jgi:hypothetical protein